MVMFWSCPYGITNGNGYLIQDSDRVVYFNFSVVSPGHTLDKAELKLYKEEPTRQMKSKCRIEIFRLRRGNDTEDTILEPETNLTVSVDYEGWLSIKITDAANYWNRNRNENFGLYVKTIDVETGQEIDLNKSGIRGFDGPKDKQPFMIAFVNKQDGVDVQHTRSGRRAERSTNNEPENEDCQRHPLYINFTALGWHSHVQTPLYISSTGRFQKDSCHSNFFE
ncbi:hypothetical protein CHS0354_034236 [Potamilus streckersoni]|uniref:TGF-beta propeptide domain-containing protein n=1 Tax=Potamilus streckersoni TaxID=2493646 RepID=A0AAE0SV38_9BIVA|nr:hypothetical protein CHS0354_034236 [Potamilus streckersoni]